MPCNQSNTLKHALCSSPSPLRRGGGEVLERICSKLGGGLERAIVPVDSSVVPIDGPYSHRAGELQDMVLRSMGCVNINSEYTTIDSHFSIIDYLKTINNPENDLYFYHSDHLGSSSFITDADGIVTQHLQYLPYGESFVEQRDAANYYTPYKFSAKEKDEETGYSYFGARYYMPELSIWSAVDPMTDKYPSMSAYMYCAGNPIRFIDLDGNSFGDPPNIIGIRAHVAFSNYMRRISGNSGNWRAPYTFSNRLQADLMYFGGNNLSRMGSVWELKPWSNSKYPLKFYAIAQIITYITTANSENIGNLKWAAGSSNGNPKPFEGSLILRDGQYTFTYSIPNPSEGFIFYNYKINQEQREPQPSPAQEFVPELNPNESQRPIPLVPIAAPEGVIPTLEKILFRFLAPVIVIPQALPTNNPGGFSNPDPV